MIAKKIPNSKKSSTKSARVSGLAQYITEPERVNQIEKCVYSEAVNFISTDLQSQAAEMVALSQEAVKSKDPIDHWVLSWKANERPTPQQASEAAAIFIKQCGLEDHQYIIGLHDDTENMHLHIAVNRVHPDTCKVVKINKGFDKEAAHQAIAIIEKKQGWSVEENPRYRTNDLADLVIDPTTKRPQIFTAGEKQQQPTTQAQAMEIQTGQKSAQRIGIENAAPIIANSTTWQELHAAMAEAGMQYQRKGSGAVVQVGAELVKASNIDRKASLSALEKRLGPYQPSQVIQPIKNHEYAPQPLKENQPGWHEYIAIRDAQRAAKMHATTDQQKRHGEERAALAAKQKAERAVIFAGNWQGKGEAKNVLKSVVAIQQAAEKLELSQQHKDERKALQAQYKPLPIYKEWKEQPQIVSLHVLPLIEQRIERDKPVTVAQTLRSLSCSVDARKHITYQLDRKDVFRDEGRTIAILDTNSDQGIAAALATAQQKFGPTLELTGSEAFKKKAVAVAVANHLTCRFSDPELDKLREQLQQQKYQVERDAARAERERLAAERLETSKAKAKVEATALERPPTTVHPTIQQTREVVPLLAPALETQQPEKLDKQITAVDYLADIQQQIEVAKSAADRSSMLAHSTTTDADHDAPGSGVIIASNDEFLAVQQGRSVKLYRVQELTKQLTYDGIDTGSGRFAVGNALERKNSKNGMRTLLSEEREDMQTEAKCEQQSNRDLGL